MLLRLVANALRRAPSTATASCARYVSEAFYSPNQRLRFFFASASLWAPASVSASSPSLSIWRRKKEMGKEGLIVAKELKRLQSDPVRLDRFIRSHVSRLLKSDLLAVLAEFQRQDQVFLCMKVRTFSFRTLLV